ncbi:MAG: hypothetical protein QOE90_1973 [Thermoplasmata archaeon]|nr:hypothetical protein [Thermoplasmata archaeon]
MVVTFVVGAESPHMQRNQILAVLVGLASAGGVALYALGTANAAEWHTYTGDVYPGHAYAVQIPSDTRSLEARFAGNGSASLTLLDPSGAKVGYYALDGKLPAAAVAQPAAGAYTLFVYGLTDGALTLAVDSASTPQAQLAELPLARQDVQVASFDQPAPLDKAMTATFHAAPLFVTVLYQGSVEALDATLASGKGDVMTIAGESGTAFSPGVAVAQQGARANTFGNLEGTAYTLTAHAKSFQGTLFLTGVSVAPSAAVAPAAHAPRHAHNASQRQPQATTTTATFSTDAPTTLRLDVGHAYAFAAQPGKLLLEDPMQKGGATVLVYRPDDVLLGAYPVGTQGRSVDLPVAGEYVAYVARASDGLVYAQVPGGDGHGADLALGHENFSASFQSLGLDQASAPFHLDHVPVDLRMLVVDDVAVAGGYEVTNAKGMVASWSALVDLGGSDPFGTGGTYVDPANFAAGDHVLRADGVAQGSVSVLTTYFERAIVAETPTPPPAPPTPPANEPSNQTGNDTWNGTFPWDPTSGPFPPAPDAPQSMPMIPEIPALPRLI